MNELNHHEEEQKAACSQQQFHRIPPLHNPERQGKVGDISAR